MIVRARSLRLAARVWACVFVTALGVSMTGFLGSVAHGAPARVQGGLSKSTAVRKPAAAKPTASKSAKPVTGPVRVVITETTQIYSAPDLDASVVAIAKRGMKIPVSKGTRGDFAKFYKTRVDGKIGWVLILDVRTEAEAKKLFTQATAAAYKPGPFKDPDKEEADEDSRREPFTFTRSVSFVFGVNDYKESINGVDHSDHLTSYGLKLTGPDVFLTGPLMDVNLMLHYGAPSYYSELSSTKPSGFVLWTDANLLLPILARENYLIGIGAGPLLVISNIKASQGAQDSSLWQVNLGADVELTAGLRLGDFVMRLEGKYMFEKKTYRQAQIAFGTVF